MKKVFHKNFSKITRKHLCQSLFFNEVADLSLELYLKKRFWRMYLPVNFAKFIRTPFLTEHFQWLFLYLWYLERTRANVFYVEAEVLDMSR